MTKRFNTMIGFLPVAAASLWLGAGLVEAGEAHGSGDFGGLSSGPTAKSVADWPAPVQCTRMLKVANVHILDHLNLRAGPNAGAKALIGIPPGAEGVQDHGEAWGGWRKVSYRGVTGYVHGRFVAGDVTICLLRQETSAPTERPQRRSFELASGTSE
ncbi:MAG: SH3 domain-containing protein [Hyphomicrobium sp.]